MSKSSDVEYIEEFRREYRAGNKDFAKSESQRDRQIVGQVIFSMENYELEKGLHEDARLKQPLTFEEAVQEVPKSLLGRKDVRKVNQLLMKDMMEHDGMNVEIAAHAFKISLDVARAGHLIRDSENVARKFKNCTEKNTDLLRQLHDAQQKITRLETMIRVLGRNPDEASSYSTDVEEGASSHE